MLTLILLLLLQLQFVGETSKLLRQIRISSHYLLLLLLLLLRCAITIFYNSYFDVSLPPPYGILLGALASNYIVITPTIAAANYTTAASRRAVSSILWLLH